MGFHLKFPNWSRNWMKKKTDLGAIPAPAAFKTNLTDTKKQLYGIVLVDLNQ